MLNKNDLIADACGTPKINFNQLLKLEFTFVLCKRFVKSSLDSWLASSIQYNSKLYAPSFAVKISWLIVSKAFSKVLHHRIPFDQGVLFHLSINDNNACCVLYKLKYFLQLHIKGDKNWSTYELTCLPSCVGFFQRFLTEINVSW